MSTKNDVLKQRQKDRVHAAKTKTTYESSCLSRTEHAKFLCYQDYISNFACRTLPKAKSTQSTT